MIRRRVRRRRLGRRWAGVCVPSHAHAHARAHTHARTRAYSHGGRTHSESRPRLSESRPRHSDSVPLRVTSSWARPGSHPEPQRPGAAAGAKTRIDQSRLLAARSRSPGPAPRAHHLGKRPAGPPAGPGRAHDLVTAGRPARAPRADLADGRDSPAPQPTGRRT